MFTLFLFSFPCGELIWLTVSFWAQINSSHRIVLYHFECCFIESSTVPTYVYVVIVAAVIIAVLVVVILLLLKKRQLGSGTQYYFEMIFATAARTELRKVLFCRCL